MASVHLRTRDADFRLSEPFAPCALCRWFCRGLSFRRNRVVSPDDAHRDAGAGYAAVIPPVFLFLFPSSRRLPSIGWRRRMRANPADFQNFIASTQISQRLDGRLNNVGMIA